MVMKLPTTPQEAFDNAWKGIIEQGKLSKIDYFGNCFYRSVDGSRCAVGHNIPDNMYNASFENRRAELIVKCLEITNYNIIDILITMQGIHDNSTSLEEWAKKSYKLAKEMELSIDIELYTKKFGALS